MKSKQVSKDQVYQWVIIGLVVVAGYLGFGYYQNNLTTVERKGEDVSINKISTPTSRTLTGTYKKELFAKGELARYLIYIEGMPKYVIALNNVVANDERLVLLKQNPSKTFIFTGYLLKDDHATPSSTPAPTSTPKPPKKGFALDEESFDIFDPTKDDCDEDKCGTDKPSAVFVTNASGKHLKNYPVFVVTSVVLQ